MKEKQLKRLSRTELLELLLEQTRQSENLQKKLNKAEALLAERYLNIQEAGNLANAVIQINGLMEAAQASAQQYLDNIKKMEEKTRLQCEALLDQAREEARQIREQALEDPVPEEETPTENLPEEYPD